MVGYGTHRRWIAEASEEVRAGDDNVYGIRAMAAVFQQTWCTYPDLLDQTVGPMNSTFLGVSLMGLFRWTWPAVAGRCLCVNVYVCGRCVRIERFSSPVDVI